MQKSNDNQEVNDLEIKKTSSFNRWTNNALSNLEMDCLFLILQSFNQRLTYVNVAGSRKTANLVYEAFMSADIKLGNIRLFHTDRGKEFDNKVISQMLETFDIKRSLSKPGCPYDNAVAEATFKTFKTEFCHKRFESSDQLKMELFRYVNWYNKYRLHSSLGYMSAINYRNSNVYSKPV